LDYHYALLAQESLLHISGPDSLDFLQGQTTCDTREISPERALPGVYCTPQGRAICDFLLCELGPGHFAMRMRRGIRQAAATAFGKYIVFSKASLDAENEERQVLGLWGADAAALLEKAFGRAPEGALSAHAGEGYTLVQVDASGRRFECYLDAAGSAALADASGTAGTEETWRRLEIDSGVARIEAETVEMFVPQVLNYDLTGHISFTKGCYTGQEVVARLHYRGTPKRRCFLADLPAGNGCAPGSPVYAASGAQSVGDIVNIAGGERALVAATLTGVEAGLHLESPEGPALVTSLPPYPLESG
jgi:folate-binding protein YgfZ